MILSIILGIITLRLKTLTIETSITTMFSIMTLSVMSQVKVNVGFKAIVYIF
jgi:hypothetical protein